jgi:hypothetical protein
VLHHQRTVGRWWASSAGDEEHGHDLLADPEAVVQVARILRDVGVLGVP